LIRELKNYKRKEDQTGKATNVPIDKINHGIDADRFAALAMALNRKRLGVWGVWGGEGVAIFHGFSTKTQFPSKVVGNDFVQPVLILIAIGRVVTTT
jgi:hypothetical protein